MLDKNTKNLPGYTFSVSGSTKFTVGTQGLETSIDCIYRTDEWWAEDDLPPNMQWEHVTVATPEHMKSWIRAKNRWLAAAWTPNQTSEERAENTHIMREAEYTMASLEIDR